MKSNRQDEAEARRTLNGAKRWQGEGVINQQSKGAAKEVKG